MGIKDRVAVVIGCLDEPKLLQFFKEEKMISTSQSVCKLSEQKLNQLLVLLAAVLYYSTIKTVVCPPRVIDGTPHL